MTGQEIQSARLLQVRWLLVAGIILIYMSLCGWPYVGWAQYPSLFDDDFTRVGSLRRYSVVTSLWRPFNEHLAPLFELISWLAWWAARKRVEGVASTFLAMSYLAVLLTTLTLGAVIYLESRSTLGALVAVAMICLESVAAETVLWYSASSFQWSAVMSLAAWITTLKATQVETVRERRCWLAATCLFACLSPLFSAIGLLAGPLASFRFRLGVRRSEQGSSTGNVVVPILGTLLYLLLILLNSDHGSAVTSSVRRHVDLLATLRALIEAPGLILLPAIIGFTPQVDRFTSFLAATLTMTYVAPVLIWGWVDPRHRGLLWTSLAWTLGGYGLAYVARAQPGDRWIMEVGRYHLFPLIGVSVTTSFALSLLLERLETKKPLAGWLGLLVVTGTLFIAHEPAMRRIAADSYHFPNQGQTIAAGLRLEAICQTEQISLAQAIRIIDPVRPRWFPRPLPFHPILYLFGEGPTMPRAGDLEARHQILAALNLDERCLIFGGLDASPYLGSSIAPNAGSKQCMIPVRGRGEARNSAAGLTYFVEFHLPETRVDLGQVSLQGVSTGTSVEIWWTGDDDHWTRSKSIRLIASDDGRPILLTRLPHWRTVYARRLRVVRRNRPFDPQDKPVLLMED